MAKTYPTWPVPGGTFRLTPNTQRFLFEGPLSIPALPVATFEDQMAGRLLLVNTDGHGTSVVAYPSLDPARDVVYVEPAQALQAIQQGNLLRIERGLAPWPVPGGLVLRSKATQAPPQQALEAFPGSPKSYYPGGGAWSGVGLWVRMTDRPAAQLEMLSGDRHWIRKPLHLVHAAQWLVANGHAVPWPSGTIEEEPGEGQTHRPTVARPWEGFPTLGWRGVDQGDLLAEARAAMDKARTPAQMSKAKLLMEKAFLAEWERMEAAKAGKQGSLQAAVAAAPVVQPLPVAPPMPQKAAKRPRQKKRGIR
jgi:hypothetical protein